MKTMHLCDIAAGGVQAVLGLRDGSLVEVDGSIIPVRYKSGRGKDLIVLFHPALKPERLGTPWFQPFLPVGVPQVAIADPTLLSMQGVAAGWYLGGEGEGLPPKITRLVRAIAQILGCKRRVYVGGSSGGFAALLFAGLDDQSVAVAACPQTNLRCYGNSHLQNFLAQKYPETLKLPPEADLPSFLPARWKSAAVLLVSSGDHGHLHQHVLPLVTALGFERRINVAINVAYHGVLGHSGSVPPAVYEDWVRAVLQCPRFTTDDVIQTHHTIQSSRIPSQSVPHQSATASTDASGASSAAIAFADILRDHQLRQIKET